MKKYIKSTDISPDYKYKVRGYYDERLYGLADSYETNDLDDAIDAVHEFCSHGDYVEIQNVIDGGRLVYSPDEWLDNIDMGDVPPEIKEL